PTAAAVSITQQDLTTTGGQATFGASNTTAGIAALGVTAGTAPTTTSSSAQITWTPGAPSRITLAPGTTTAIVGTTLTETATVTDQYGNRVADGTSLTFSLSGVTTLNTSATTSGGQAALSYSPLVPGSDTLTVSVAGESDASAQATITWQAPTSTPDTRLVILSSADPLIKAQLFTGAQGGTPTGYLVWQSDAVRFRVLFVSSLVRDGRQATLYGTGMLADGSYVSWRLDADAVSKVVRLRLSTGYDSGWSRTQLLGVADL
ncbi:MAG: hypothetical protein ACRDNS_19515, partial [Trebonia sp.]